jgi:hypothetical protein
MCGASAGVGRRTTLQRLREEGLATARESFVSQKSIGILNLQDIAGTAELFQQRVLPTTRSSIAIEIIWEV